MQAIMSAEYDLAEVQADTGQRLSGRIAIFAGDYDDRAQAARDIVFTPEDALWIDDRHKIPETVKRLRTRDPHIAHLEDRTSVPILWCSC